ncbi:CCNH family protein [Megaselia abdita]
MFPNSSQKKYWSYKSVNELSALRIKQNQDFISQNQNFMQEGQIKEYFLTPQEEYLLLKQYELYLRDFCRRFQPAMPRSVIGTAFHYFKRFYLNNSPMDFHPKEILATCVYLSCKVEEFNVSIKQFSENIKGDREKAEDIILSNELLLMQHLNYYLTVHNPFRPVEGFLIDIKTRCSLIDPERLRAGIEDFLDKTFLTDACVLYSPSQIALAAVLHSACKVEENLDSYVTDNLFQNARDKLPTLIDAIRKIRVMVKNVVPPPRDTIKMIEKKLEICRNQANNPDSDM